MAHLLQQPVFKDLAALAVEYGAHPSHAAATVMDRLTLEPTPSHGLQTHDGVREYCSGAEDTDGHSLSRLGLFDRMRSSAQSSSSSSGTPDADGLSIATEQEASEERLLRLLSTVEYGASAGMSIDDTSNLALSSDGWSLESPGSSADEGLNEFCDFTRFVHM
ncbi:uncharacterized protein AB675_11849 [Cyphellophora attinorum]|uniref:Uncharacterized protein n=1 Tax=Cyphellophora attinorum TaxID=1664694 RepID=A0A0N0NJL4_9EURO|nr:uncharacterized protein AB675_11849 [Phialophora attinorum]KPI36789.1 hypothetical protein AB675_11849 [Phialophora attinorum]